VTALAHLTLTVCSVMRVMAVFIVPHSGTSPARQLLRSLGRPLEGYITRLQQLQNRFATSAWRPRHGHLFCSGHVKPGLARHELVVR